MKEWLRTWAFWKRKAPHGSGTVSFEDLQRADEAFECRDRGIRTVPLAKIVGSVGRYQDFDDKFRLKNQAPSERLEGIKNAMRRGKVLPPVRLWQIRDAYYVEDGNHRVAAAKALGHDEILAHIVEFVPSGDDLEGVLYRQRADFLDATQLHADITLSEPGQYEHLLEQIRRHQAFLEKSRGGPVSFPDAAADWYQYIYRPLCAIIKKERLLEEFPGRTAADLYTYISVRLWEKGERRHYGIGINEILPDDMEAFREKMSGGDGVRYPEMQRNITAFVLMSVQAKKEHKIVERLYELEEVREIHSVHGDVDVLVKIQLTRDLLSSDAEVISDFVHENIRQLPGVHFTKTLIPGMSKIKD